MYFGFAKIQVGQGPHLCILALQKFKCNKKGSPFYYTYGPTSKMDFKLKSLRAKKKIKSKIGVNLSVALSGAPAPLSQNLSGAGAPEWGPCPTQHFGFAYFGGIAPKIG
jgi:hypothetical protein